MTRTHETAPLLADPKVCRHSCVDDHVDGVAGAPVRDPPESSFVSPLDWSPRFKWGIVALLAYSAFTVCVVALRPSWLPKQSRLQP